jgi:hypothetical protein
MSIRKKVLLSTFMFALVAALGTFAYVAKKGKININADTITPSTQHFPSVKYAAQGTRSDTNYIVPGTPTTIRDWEAAHYDLIVAGALYPEYNAVNPNLKSYYYDLMRYETFLGDKWGQMRDYAIAHSFSFEDYFVHYAEDTQMSAIHDSSTSVSDKFPFVYDNTTKITSAVYSGTTTWSFGKTVGSALSIGQTDKFDEVNFNFTTAAGAPFAGVWEYSAGNDSTNNVNNWKALSVISDTTNQMKQSGKVRFTPPSDWTIGQVNNSLFDQDQAREFFVRFRVTVADAQYPRGTGYGIKPAAFYLPKVVSDTTIKIYGWDAAADLNHDDYLDDTEWASHAANKNARFKWWSRLPGRNYMPPSSFKINPGGSYKDFEAQYVYNQVTIPNSAGASRDGVMWDEFWTHSFFPWGETEDSGGTTYEYSNKATRDTDYGNDLIAAVEATKTLISPIEKLVSGNVSSNLGGYTAAENVFDIVSTESQLYGSSTYTTLYLKEPTITRINNLGKKLVIQGQMHVGMFTALGSTDAAWDRLKLVNLCHFLLMQNPDYDYFFNWSGTYYGSGSVSNPTPVKMFPGEATVDMGVPTNVIPTPVGGTQYPKVKTNTSGMFIFATGTDPSPNNTGGTYYVVGRDYTKALILDKPIIDGYSSSTVTNYDDQTGTTHILPILPDNPSGRYYLANHDGTISSAPITSISLRNVDGAILIKESALNGSIIIPTVNAGPDVTAVASFTQNATTTNAVSYAWTKTSGPGTITFGSATSEDTTITASSDGSYVVRLTVTSSTGDTAYDEFNLTWSTAIPLPTVNAGPDVTINTTFTQNAATTNATSYLWSKVSGSGTITFGTATAEDTTITASTAGTYVIRLTATNSTGSAHDEFTLNWTSPGSLSVSAGSDQTSYPTRVVNQIASASNATSYQWTKVSGPGDIAFGTATAKDTTITASAAGTYTLRLTVRDASSNSLSDDMTLTVYKNADINNDGSINNVDFTLMMYNWGSSPLNIMADINRDGAVNNIDFTLLMYSFGT